MRFELINCARVTIRRLRLEDAERISYYRNLPEVAKYQSPWSKERASNLIKELQESEPTVLGRWFQFGIELVKTGELIGDVGVLNSDPNQKSWIGFTLDPAFWGNGYATEAVNSILDLYSKNGVSAVWAAIEPDNHASAKVLTRLQFNLVESTPNDLIFCKSL